MKKFLFLVLLLMACQSKNTNIETLRDGFQTPPATARPGVYWYFMDGNFSREGVTKDLEAMKRAGIGYVIFLEENVVDYPDWATRELVMNAICHRDYESNGPIQFYQYADRIEIENHGGLYGRANEQNFPNVNDYRNLIVAEGMKVLGFVNRQSRGVLKVQRELRENENGEAVYDFGYQTAVLVCEKKSPRGERLKEDAIRNGWLKENAQKPSGMEENEVKSNQKPSNVTENELKAVTEKEKPSFPNLIVQNVYQAIKMNRKTKYSQLEDNLGVSESTILRTIGWLKENGYINRERSKVKGEWQLL